MSSQASLDHVSAADLSAPVSARKAAPVTAHPWFAGFVALWLAALLGASSLVLAPAMLERIVAASGIASFVSAAAPPLGQTARLLLALGLAGLGGVVGLLLGRFLAGRSRGAASDQDVVYVSSDGEIDGEAPTLGAGDASMGLRDRLARLTGQGDGPRDFDDLPKLRTRDRHPDAPGRKPLLLSDIMARDATNLDGNLHEVPLIGASAIEKTRAPAPFSGPPPIMADAWAAPEPDTAPPALAAVADEVLPDAASAVSAADEPLELEIATAQPASAPLFTAASAPNPAIAEATLDSLGVVQLTERLAIAMRARRERNARRAAAAAAPVQESTVVLPSLCPVDPAAALAPGEAESGEPKRNGPELTGEALETGYLSLLGLSRPSLSKSSAQAASLPGPFAAPSAAAPFAIDGPGKEAVASPETQSRFAATSDPAENSRALEAALASLQRISSTR